MNNEYCSLPSVKNASQILVERANGLSHENKINVIHLSQTYTGKNIGLLFQL